MTAAPTLLSEHSIIIPAFNEGAAIAGCLAALCAEPRLAETEIIVVDDGSTDNTAQQAGLFSGRVRLISHSANKGYSTALRTGMLQATKKYVTWMDSDGQHRLEDLLAVMETLEREKVDYCVGVRNAQSHQEKNRILGKWLLRHAVNFAAGQTVADFNSGLRGFRREVILPYLHLLPERFGASTTTSLLMLERGYLGAYVNITVQQRVGTSSVKIIRDGLRTLMLILRIFLLFKPLNFFGTIGCILASIGLVYGFWVALAEGQGFPILGAVIVLFGVQTLFLGLIMDAISALRRDAFFKRP